MGSWAEGCCISNLEIDQGTPIVVGFITEKKFNDLNSGAFAIHTMATPLLRGKYDDYGGIDIEDTAENVSLFLKVWNRLHREADPEHEDIDSIGDNKIRDNEGTPKGLVMWMARQDAFEMLRTVRHEYSGDSTKRVGESEAKILIGLRAGLVELADPTSHARWSLSMWEGDRLDRYRGLGLSEEKLAELDARRQARTDHSISNQQMLMHVLRTDVFKGGFDDDIIALQHLGALILEDKANEHGQNDLYARSIAEIQMLRIGLGELRKALVPLYRTGPQYNGWLAMEDFAKFLNKAIKGEKEERRLAKLRDKEMMRRWAIGKAKFKEVHGREATTQEDNSEVYKYGQEAE